MSLLIYMSFPNTCKWVMNMNWWLLLRSSVWGVGNVVWRFSNMTYTPLKTFQVQQRGFFLISKLIYYDLFYMCKWLLKCNIRANIAQAVAVIQWKVHRQNGKKKGEWIINQIVEKEGFGRGLELSLRTIHYVDSYTKSNWVLNYRVPHRGRSSALIQNWVEDKNQEGVGLPPQNDMNMIFIGSIWWEISGSEESIFILACHSWSRYLILPKIRWIKGHT